METPHRHFNIIGTRRNWYLLSTFLILPGIVSLFVWGLPVGIDFKGGTLQDLHLNQNRPAIEQLRSDLSSLKISDLSVQTSGNQDVLIRFPDQAKQKPREIGDSIVSKLKQQYPTVSEVSFENIGGSVASSTTQKAVWAVIIASAAIILFIAWSFASVPKPASSWRFGVTAILALGHDILFVIGAFSLIGHFFAGI
ncbi:hypothetical protein KGQ71_00220, partial [Patescibacteria group bacterium]|nr:hypothetical protein [Patescibacteria group bacterium]